MSQVMGVNEFAELEVPGPYTGLEEEGVGDDWWGLVGYPFGPWDQEWRLLCGGGPHWGGGSDGGEGAQGFDFVVMMMEGFGGNELRVW